MTNTELRAQMAQYAADQRDMLSQFGTLMVNSLKVARMALTEVSKPFVLLSKVSEKPISTIARLNTAANYLDRGKPYKGTHRSALESLKRDNYQ